MRARCAKESGKCYKNYGGRGIAVCKRWDKYENFLADMGEAPPGKSLDRINNNRGYMPSNCRWATPKEQARNKRTNIMVTLGKETLCVTDWAARLGVRGHTLRARYHAGTWP